MTHVSFCYVVAGMPERKPGECDAGHVAGRLGWSAGVLVRAGWQG